MILLDSNYGMPSPSMIRKSVPLLSAVYPVPLLDGFGLIFAFAIRSSVVSPLPKGQRSHRVHFYNPPRSAPPITKIHSLSATELPPNFTISIFLPSVYRSLSISKDGKEACVLLFSNNGLYCSTLSGILRIPSAFFLESYKDTEPDYRYVCGHRSASDDPEGLTF